MSRIMPNSRYNRSIFLLFISGLVRVAHSIDYSDLEALGVSCPERDKCDGYSHNLGYMDRNCECDSECMLYGDCCIDASVRRYIWRMRKKNNTVCMNYGKDDHTGVYVVARCSSRWNGSDQVRQKCEGSLDLSDPVEAAPVTNAAQSVTYKNLFCAECNNADMEFLKIFQLQLSCEGFDDISQEEKIGNLIYDGQRASWGLNRLDAQGNTTFVECDVVFDVPDYLRSYVRFCRTNVISTCARDWTRQAIRIKCQEYMAVVHDATNAYRNPHCAICNHRKMDDITCRALLRGRKRPMSYELVLDVNKGEGDQVGMSFVYRTFMRECASGHKYDPFFKKCRKLVCALPGYEAVNGRCVPGGGS